MKIDLDFGGICRWNWIIVGIYEMHVSSLLLKVQKKQIKHNLNLSKLYNLKYETNEEWKMSHC